MNEENNFQGKLSSMISACALQARWHHEQYVRLQYCQQYFIYLLQNKHCLEKDYLDDFFQNITADNAKSHPWSTQNYAPWVHPSNNMNERRESSTSEVQCKRKKRKKKKKKRKTSQAFENDDNESESDLEVDEGFKAFHRETARFRAERGFSFI